MISIVIPTLDEERALPITLDAVSSQTGNFEVLVVDGGSEDTTQEVVERYAAEHPKLHWLTADRGRARQLNAGAKQAQGDWFLFLHADTQLPEGALESIEALPAKNKAGCFRQRFSGSSRLLAALSWFHNRRFRVTRVMYGDQAMFIRRELFRELAGFPDRKMEDVAFSLTLRSVTQPLMLPLTVTTDARKFDQMGHWRALGRAIGLLLRFRFGADLERDPFFDSYR
jgi:rSAM/selenodomain-associated transferase 2